MSRPIAVTALLAALALPAIAAGWSSYESAFPSLPCSDGWAACLASGGVVSAGPLRDAGGRPVPSDFRVGWFDLQATGAFSPFVGLSTYQGAVGGAVADVTAAPTDAPVDAGPAQPADDGLADAAPSSGSAPNTVSAPARVPVTGAAQPAAVRPTAAVVTPTASTSSVSITSTPVASTSAPATGSVRPSSAPVATAASPTMPPPASATPATGSVRPSTAAAQPATTGAPSGAQPVSVAATGSDDSCDDLVRLEPAAMMGQLRAGQSKCLDARIGGESAQTMKDKLSRLLIANADAAGNKSEWERLMKRHLEDIDRSDPDMCLRYAQHLARGGTARAPGVIRWADYALENKAKWTGNTYKTRVYTLLRVRAEAAAKLWQEASEAFTADRSDEAEAKETKYRGMAKDYAREWLDYAKASAQDTKKATELCVSAAGNRAFCEGG